MIVVQKSSLLLAGLFLLAAGAACGYFGAEFFPSAAQNDAAHDETPAESSLGNPVVRVKTVLATQADLPLTVDAIGVVRADPSALLSMSSRAGGRVEEVHAVVGQTLRSGELILRLASAPLDEAVAQAEAVLDRATSDLDAFLLSGRTQRASELSAEIERVTASLALAKEQVERLTGLLTEGLVSDVAVANARRAESDEERDLRLAQQALAAFQGEGGRTQGEGLKAAVRGAQAALRDIKAQRSELEVRALKDCTVFALDVTPGETLSPGATIGTLLVNEQRLVAFAVQPMEARSLVIGAKVRWQSDVGHDGEGVVLRIRGWISNPSGASEVVVAPSAQSMDLPLGLIVRGEITRATVPGAILVPEAAVLRQDSQRIVVIAGLDGKAQIQEVEVLGRHGGLAAVRGAVEVGDRIVVEGGYNLEGGTELQIDAMESGTPDAEGTPR